MRFFHRKEHIIDMIFPIILFFLFVGCAFLFIFLSSTSYQNTMKIAQSNHEARTVFLYLSQKIHQSDEFNSIRIGRFDGRDSLVIEQTFDSKYYQTYIYEENGMLCELFAQKGIDISASDGKEIIPISNFSMQKVKNGVFSFSYLSKQGTPLQTVLSVKTQPFETDQEKN